MPLHVSDITGSLFESQAAGTYKPDTRHHPLGTAEELAERTGAADTSKEFGEFTYEDAAQLIVLKATTFDASWLQSRFAIDSDKATTLLLRLVGNEVIQRETEAERTIDDIYKVIAALADLGPNLSVE